CAVPPLRPRRNHAGANRGAHSIPHALVPHSEQAHRSAPRLQSGHLPPSFSNRSNGVTPRRPPPPTFSMRAAYAPRSASDNPVDTLFARFCSPVAFAPPVPTTHEMEDARRRRPKRPTASKRSNQSPQPDVIPDLWFKNAIIYNLDVRSFMDADGNGLGDFRGLTGRLDYLAGLRATC